MKRNVRVETNLNADEASRLRRYHQRVGETLPAAAVVRSLLLDGLAYRERQARTLREVDDG